MQLADKNHRNRFILCQSSHTWSWALCVQLCVSCALWDSDPRAVCSLVGEMKIHRRANTTDLGITAHWRTHQKHCFTTERSTRAEIIRDWAGFLELKDILCSGPLGRKGKDIFGQRISISQDEKLDPAGGRGLFLGQWRVPSDESWGICRWSMGREEWWSSGLRRVQWKMGSYWRFKTGKWIKKCA